VWLRQLSPTPTEVLLRTTTLNFQSAFEICHSTTTTIKDAGTNRSIPRMEASTRSYRFSESALLLEDVIGKLQGNAPKRDASMTLYLHTHNS
jgi:hypothetical protein